MRILVCGGRDYRDKKRAFEVLDSKCGQSADVTIICGAASGADQLAYEYALSRSYNCENYPADWSRLGRAAGPIRNQKMIDEGRPECVIAFPGGRGTADLVRRARAAGIPVQETAKD